MYMYCMNMPYVMLFVFLVMNTKPEALFSTVFSTALFCCSFPVYMCPHASALRCIYFWLACFIYLCTPTILLTYL